MTPEVISALIGCTGIVVGAIPTYVFMRQRNAAELAKLDAETDKLKAEAEKIRSEFPLAAAQAQRVRMLFVAADPPRGTRPQLRLGEEIRGIVHGMRASNAEERFELEQLWGARWQDFRRQLLTRAPEIVHFAGMAQGEALCFEEDGGGVGFVSNEQFSSLMKLFSDRVRLVIINTPSTDLCQQLAHNVDFVIGIQGRVKDDDAIAFATAFYEALGEGKAIPTAFEFAKASISPEEGEKSYQLYAERKHAGAHLLPEKASAR
jgi:hypothetical protein